MESFFLRLCESWYTTNWTNECRPAGHLCIPRFSVVGLSLQLLSLASRRKSCRATNFPRQLSADCTASFLWWFRSARLRSVRASKYDEDVLVVVCISRISERGNPPIRISSFMTIVNGRRVTSQLKPSIYAKDPIRGREGAECRIKISASCLYSISSLFSSMLGSSIPRSSFGVPP
jgi:hypothetical protein